MSTTVVVGAQWGDEGKGKVVDVLTADAKVVVRFNGGANAGHTIVVGDKKYALHLLPSGIVREGVLNIVGPYVVCDPEVIVQELAIAEQAGARVLLDHRASIVLPIHKSIDEARETASGESGIGTTKRGIGPCYEDWASRRGPTLGDLVDPVQFERALRERGYYAEKLAQAAHLSCSVPALEPVGTADMIARVLGDSIQTVHERIAKGENVLFEGAQGVMLDVIHGGRPYCTSSFCGAGGVSASMGVHKFDRVIGISKAYATRVGGGAFPTELDDATGEHLRERGHEVGTTTGRVRRCGWLDLVALRYACRVGGITQLILTKADVFYGLETLRVCVDYKLGNDSLEEFQTLTASVLEQAKPLYRDFVGLGHHVQRLAACERIKHLPSPLRTYIDFIQEYLGIPIVALSVGPEREEMVWE